MTCVNERYSDDEDAATLPPLTVAQRICQNQRAADVAALEARTSRLPWHLRRCQACPIGLTHRHGLCPDPFGDLSLCYCYAASSTHRLQWDALGIEEATEARQDADGGLGSRRIVDMWEWEQERFLERTTERG